MINIDIVRIPNTPMKLVVKDGYEIYGAFWYGDNFYRRESFTPEMQRIADTYHAATLVERLEKADA